MKVAPLPAMATGDCATIYELDSPKSCMPKVNKIPEIRIKYNRFLDPIFIFYCKNNPELKARGWNDWIPPDTNTVIERVEKYRNEWNSNGERVLRGMYEALDLEFKRNVIDVHIVSGLSRAFSAPIIIKSGFSPKEFVDVLSHELVHVLLQDNIELVSPMILSETFPAENQLVRNHILVHAVLTYIYLEILEDESRLHQNILRSKNADADAYSHAWEIVEREGYKKLIDGFKKKVASLDKSIQRGDTPEDW